MSVTSPTLRLGPAAVGIAGAASAFPAEGWSTAALVRELAPDLPTPRREALVRFVEEEVGVRHRAHVRGEERAWTLAADAAEAALAQAGQPALAAHVHVTSTPSRWTGADAARIGQRLGLRSAHLDLRGGCTGGLWGLIQAARLCRDAGEAVLLTAADALSLTLPSGPEGDRMLPLAMGDGATALVFTPAPSGGLQCAVVGGAPALADLSTVHRELPDGDGPMTLGGDPAAFSEATGEGLRLALASIEAPSEALGVIHARADTARRLWAEPYLEVLAHQGMLGVASLPTALGRLWAAKRSGPVVLATAGGGLGFGAAVWTL